MDEPSYTFVGYCFGSDLASYTLGQAPGRPERVALVFLHKRDAQGLRIVRLQYIEPDQVLAAKVCFRRPRKFCAIVSPPGGHNSMPRIPETADEAGSQPTPSEKA